MITALIILLLMNLFGCSNKSEPKGPVKYLQYSCSEMRDRVEFVYTRAEDGSGTLTKKRGYNDEEGQTIQLPASVGDELWKIVQEYKMYSYKESYSPAFEVRDGYMWKLRAKFTEGNDIYTSGDNAMPDNGRGIRKLVDYLNELWDRQNLPQVKSMNYRVNGSVAEPLCYFMLKHDPKNYKRFLLINGSLCHRTESRAVEVPVSFVEQIHQIVQEEKMLDYACDYRPEYDVLDGRSWTIYIDFEYSKVSVYSSGYEAYPPTNGLERIEKLCRDTWKELESKSVQYPLDD